MNNRLFIEKVKTICEDTMQFDMGYAQAVADICALVKAESAPSSANKQSIKLPKNAVENIVECISNQHDIPVEFKAILVNNFWDLL